MENSIIEDFQNLHVLAAYDLAIMDDLVHDLTIALDESSRTQRSSSRSHDSLLRRRRKFKRRKANMCMLIHGSNMSEASESSLDEAFKDYIENVTRQSDSDEFLVNGTKVPPTWSFPALSVPQMVESDSVTENITPLRPQRRRRHFKRMAVDSQSHVGFTVLPRTNTENWNQTQSSEGLVVADTGSANSHSLSGKRKRSSKDKSDNNSFDLDLNDENQQEIQGFNFHMMDGNISSLSSNESDCGNSTGDGRDGDDEESDAYHDSDCNNMLHSGNDSQDISNEDAEKMQMRDMNADIRKIFAAGLELMSPISRSCMKARMKMLNGRQMQAGRRRLKDRHPAYSLSAFLQDRQTWSHGCAGWQQPACASAGTGGASKRHRRMPPTDTNFEMMTEQTDPMVVSGKRLLSGAGGNTTMFTLGQKSARSKQHCLSSISHHFIP